MFLSVRALALIVCLASAVVLPGTAESAELVGTVQQTVPKPPGPSPLTASTSSSAADTSKAPPLLQGGVKDSASLQSSLKLRPASANSVSSPLSGSVRGTSMGSGVTDYSGRAPILSSPSYDSGIGTRSGVIPPISSYHLTPTTITTSVPQFSSVSGVTTWVSGYDAPAVVSTGSGVWAKPGYEYSVLRVEFANAYGTGTGGGGGYGYGGGIWSRDSITTVRRVETAIAPSNPNGVTVWQPGYEVCISSNNGVSTVPGYEVSVNVSGGNKQTLGGLWTAPGNATGLTAQRQVLDHVQVEPLSATPLLLPQIRATALDTKLTPQGWYKRVAKAIYSRWENSEVGAGVARIRITVRPDRQLCGQVIDFTPLKEGTRDADAETVFRETALRSVNNVNVFEVPPFPVGITADALTFEVDLKRKVDGPKGFTVAASANDDEDEDEEALPGTSACAK